MFEMDLINAGLKTAAMLFVVLGFLVLALYCMKKFISPRASSKGDVSIEVLSTRHLSPKERIEVIEVSGERLVLGITSGSISFLTKLSDSGSAVDDNGKVLAVHE